MFDIDFYEDINGNSDVRDFLSKLEDKMKTNKDARVQYKQATFYIQLLANNGTRLSENIMKNVVEDIWELRPGSNRVFFFYYDRNGKYVLLHHFRKKSQATPSREKERAIRERDDYKKRKGDAK